MTGPFCGSVHSSTDLPTRRIQVLEHGPRGSSGWCSPTAPIGSRSVLRKSVSTWRRPSSIRIAGARGGRDTADLIDLDDLVDIARIELAEARDMAAVDAMLALQEDGRPGATAPGAIIASWSAGRWA